MVGASVGAVLAAFPRFLCPFGSGVGVAVGTTAGTPLGSGAAVGPGVIRRVVLFGAGGGGGGAGCAPRLVAVDGPKATAMAIAPQMASD